MTYLTVEQPVVGDLVRLAKDREYDVKLCNADKRALRAWYEGYNAKSWKFWK